MSMELDIYLNNLHNLSDMVQIRNSIDKLKHLKSSAANTELDQTGALGVKTIEVASDVYTKFFLLSEKLSAWISKNTSTEKVFQIFPANLWSGIPTGNVIAEFVS